MLSVMSKNKRTWKTDMIKTLRITSVIAVVLAVVFFVFPAVFGVRGDERREQFLNSAGVIEKFKEAKGDKVEDRQHEISPLVKQAEAFALYLNPPPPPQPIVSEPSRPQPPRPQMTSPKFKLVGTSYYALHPELSLALIDEPGKGLRWVRQSSKVGHLIVEQVKDGLVVVRDGKSTFELVAERPEKRSLLKKTPSSGARITSSKPPEIGAEAQTSSEEKPALSGGRITSSKPPEIGAEVQRSAEEEAARKKLLAELDAKLLEMGLEEAQAGVEVGDTNSGPKTEEIATTRERPVSDLETMRISAREARRLGRWGRRLNNVQQEPNRVEDDRTESDANLNEPNSRGLNLNEPNLNDVNSPG
jgi:hypothetical protein